MAKKANRIKVLVTAGPTPVPIDRVRQISNVFGGTTGYMIALEAAMRGFDVTLLLGPHQIREMDIAADVSMGGILAKTARVILAKGKMFFHGGSLKIVHYRFFDELMKLMEENISSKEFDVVIHSAAVADYAPVVQEGKIKSSLDALVIRTTPTPKIIKSIKVWDPDIYQVQFKLEVGLTRKDLIETAYLSLMKYGSDLVVANNKAGTSTTTAAAYIIDVHMNIDEIATRKELYEKLIDKITEEI
jgi:phosphopantothenoylcysteine decarboxylase/phosphopantothenate--cysteine ligase